MKKVLLATAVAAAFLSSATNAAVYQLSTIAYGNTFTAETGPVYIGSAGFAGEIYGGSAATNAGAVSVTGLNWKAGPAQGQEYTALWDFTTNVGTNQTITKTVNDCTAVSGAFCGTTKSGYGGLVLASGNPDTTSRVTVTELEGILTIEVRRGLLDTPAGGFGSTYFQSYTFTFTEVSEVPVPAAAWLMGSGLVGLVGVARRRKQA
jgi:hypothetical protein